MEVSYSDLLGFVQHLAPTWRKTQHVNMALLLYALLQRPSLCISELARAYPSPSQPLHGRMKRLMRFLDNRHLDEGVLFVRWLKLTYRFGDNPPTQNYERPLLPVLLDTTYFEPFALLVATVACGSRGLPVALTTYHRSELKACFPPQATRPRPNENPSPPRPSRGPLVPSAASTPTTYFSQNQIEEELIDYVFSLISDALLGVLVADRGFARASLFLSLQAKLRDFVIRMDAQTHIRLPSPVAEGRPVQGLPADVLGLRPGQHLWCPQAWYGKEEQVPIKLLAVWDEGQKEPWYLASSLPTPEDIEVVYRWRMRLECANRDEKTGVLLRESGDKHALKSLMHVHRLMLALALGEWFCALTGLQAWQELPTSQSSTLAPQPGLPSLPQPGSASEPESAVAEPPPVRRADSVRGEPSSDSVDVPAPIHHSQSNVSGPATPELAAGSSEGLWYPSDDPAELGPSSPPPVIPHRGPRAKLPAWMRRFAARGHLSYVRLGLEVLRAVDLGHIVRNMVRWLRAYLDPWTPMWRPYQVAYRLKHWWADSS